MMAGRRKASYGSAYSTASQRQFYVYGNTAPAPEIMPERRGPERKTPVSGQVRKNRSRALQINAAYATFLAAAAIIAVFVCVQYLQLKAELRERSGHITALQEELADLSEQNETAYNAAVDSVNIKEILDKAVNEMGMVYPSPGQVVEYESPANDYVKQYEEIPESGVLAQSSDVSE